MKSLRDYQQAVIKSLWHWFANYPDKHPLVDAPVASGKSLMIAEFIKDVHEKFPRTRIILLSHVKELLVQTYDELIAQYPGADVGFYCAGLKQKRLHNDITIGSIQSIYNKIGNLNRVPEIIIVDECHLISHKGTTQYRKFIDTAIALNPNCKVIGFTGTVFRADTGRLDEGHNKLFDGVAYSVGMDFMISQGYWAKPVCPEIATKMDVRGVAVRGGDYVAGELERAVNTAQLNDACVREMIEKGKDRRKWLVFTAGVQHAADVTADLESTGISVGMVTGETPSGERNRIIEEFRKGKIRCLVNVAVLTTGFNVPDIDMLVFMRPTRSPVLYVQTIGRGVRPVYAGGFDLNTQQGRLDAIAASIKPDCMVLDFGGVVSTLGPIDQISIKKKYKGEVEGGGEAVMKICPSCGVECFAAQRYCYACSYCFIKLEETAGNNAIMSRDVPPEWIDVLDVYYDKHEKEGSVPSLKVSYFTMQGAIREWICFSHWQFEHEDNKRYAWDKAVKWHEERLPHEPVPTTIEDAIALKYPKPSRIFARREGKYWRIVDYEWEPRDGFIEAEKISEEEYFQIPF